MKRRTAGRVAKPRICVRCSGAISELRPVFLVSTEAGTIVGPYHAGCAEATVLQAKRPNAEPYTPGETFGRVLPKGDQEAVE